ncbi:MAG TPA: SRPBCC family protein [Methylomirabilota bacterium]|nr:SRPBCC family protein [Methylomirabilota bacterium]
MIDSSDPVVPARSAGPTEPSERRLTPVETPLRERYLVPGVLAASAMLIVGVAVQRRRRPGPPRRRPAMPTLSEGRGVHLERTVTIQRAPDEVYRAWRDLERLPSLVSSLESVTVRDDRHSHWRVRGPGGRVFTWDAEIVADRDRELIAWRSTPGSQMDVAGSVQFQPAPGGRGTEVKVILAFSPRGRRLGKWLARLSDAGDRDVGAALRRFKQMLETGEPPVVEGQPSGRTAEAPRRRQAS